MKNIGKYSAKLKAPKHRTRPRTINARLKILTIIELLVESDFTEIDIYKFLLAEREAIPISTITNNLKQLNDGGLLVSNKTKAAARLYRKSERFKELLSIEEFRPYLFNFYQPVLF